jgi:ABC-type polysaccharide/polyol phosphate transport system ATPase subunit
MSRQCHAWVLRHVTVRLKAGAVVGVVGAVRLQCNM